MYFLILNIIRMYILDVNFACACIQINLHDHNMYQVVHLMRGTLTLMPFQAGLLFILS